MGGVFAYFSFLAYVDPYQEVSEIVDNPEAYLNKQQIQVIGTVVNGSTKQGPDALLNFSLTDGNSTINVVYTGAEVPSIVEGEQSVAIGKLVAPQTIQANKILAKCPSRYESQDQTSLFSTPIFPIALILGSVAIGFTVVSVTFSKRKKR